ncbi:tetratricopeptide repeat protein [Haloferula chungangensis]|uniref:Tetratricopeptide repeat protein n=1 Tax=Haloferula chungangensis TaxID=1048331 RepID=A0ABW2L4N2_9BACT
MPFPFPVRIIVPAVLLAVAPVSPLGAQEGWSRAGLQAWGLVTSGEYESALEFAEQISEFARRDPQVVEAQLNALMSLGRYELAGERAAEAAAAFEGYIPIQVQAIEVLRRTGREAESKKRLEGLDALAKKSNPATLNAVELVALGRAALLLGAEPKLVLKQFYDRARKLETAGWQATLATAELAIEKADYALATKVLNEVRTRVGPVPDFLYLQAEAYSQSDRVRSERFLDEVLESNPRHLPAHLLRAVHAIDVEDYDSARSILDDVRKTNPAHPQAWALEAAIAYRLDQDEEGKRARSKALEPWSKNPEVDYWIGEKLSQMRRFTEGSDFLRRALEADPSHLPSKKALGQNLLRLGNDQQGWAMIREVQEADPYDVEVFNLMLLHDELEKFVTLSSGSFAVRMRPTEAAVYGKRVLELLEEAERDLGARYGYRPVEPVVVDFFPDQQDFAVRTLGIPGGLGILGACFGNVIAMNSPGSPGAMGTNWESTLWHEFCHTITLGATANRIPRWLTEGISVYEEHRRDPSCAGQMTPEFRKRILEVDGLIPISGLSAALTNFAEPETIGFAYFEASLLVGYLIETYGEDRFQQVLDDLRTNGVIEEVLARRMAAVEKLDEGFAAFAQKRAEGLAPDVDWTMPGPASPRDPESVSEILDEHPNNFWALTMRAEWLLGERRWDEAKEIGERLVMLLPSYGGASNGYSILARAYRNLGDTEEERLALREWSKVDGEATDAFLRLVELDLEASDWEALDDSARRVLSVNPLLRAPHQALGLAAEQRGDDEGAMDAFETLLELDPINPADIHFRLAGLYRDEDEAKARRHVLLALEEAPRFRAAHGLLRELKRQSEPEIER